MLTICSGCHSLVWSEYSCLDRKAAADDDKGSDGREKDGKAEANDVEENEPRTRRQQPAADRAR